MEETAVFEEVVEEIDYDAARGGRVRRRRARRLGGATMMFAGGSTLPPSTTHAVESPANTASFAAMEEATLDEPELEPLPAPDPEPEPLERPFRRLRRRPRVPRCP